MGLEDIKAGMVSVGESSRGRSVQSSGNLYRRIVDFSSVILSYLSNAVSRVLMCIFALLLSLFFSATGSAEEVQQATDSAGSVEEALRDSTEPTTHFAQGPNNGGGAAGGPSTSARSSTQLRLRVPDDSLRQSVTTSTLTEVRKACRHEPTNSRPGLLHREFSRLSHSLRSMIGRAVFYSPPRFSQSSDTSAFLPEGAAFALPTTMNYDGQWQRWSGSSTRRPFVSLHAVAINLRSSLPAAVRSYQRDMREIIFYMVSSLIRAVSDTNLLPGASRTRRHAVLPAFGAGAFLRSVLHPQNPQNQGLRNIIVTELANTMAVECSRAARESGITFHLCIAAPRSGDIESTQNYNAFKAAFERNLPSNRIAVETNVDGSALAQELADQGNAVVLVIAGNNTQLGNHWFNAGTARRAIEENVYRRSEDLAIQAFIFNGGKSSGSGKLRDYVARVGARSVQF